MLDLVVNNARPAIPGVLRRGNGYVIMEAEATHVYQLANNLRIRDAAELTSLGHSPKKSLWRGYRNSVMCRTAFIEGEIAAMWGLAISMRGGVSLLSDLGVPWLLTSPQIEKMPVAFIREAKKEVERMLKIKRRLENFVAADYAQAIRLLEVLGFTIDEPHANGIDGRPFRRFWKEAA
jgi:hypothetical protein